MKTKKDDIKLHGIMSLIFLIMASVMLLLPWDSMMGEDPLPKWKESIFLFLYVVSCVIFILSSLVGLYSIGMMVYIATARDDGWYFNHHKVTLHKEEERLKTLRYTTDLHLFHISCENFPQETPEQIAFKNQCQLFFNEAERYLGKKTVDILQVMKIHLDTIKSTLPDEKEGAILSEIKPMLKRAETLIEQAEELTT